MEYKLSVNGLYEYRPTIFNSFHLPQVWSAARLGIPETQYIDEVTRNSIDFSRSEVRQALFDRIRLDSLPFSCVYSSGEVLEAAIGIWSSSMLPRWQQLYNTLFYRFNPLWNKDATHTEQTDTDKSTNINRTSSALDRTTYTSAAKDRNTDLVRSYEEGTVELALDTPIPRTQNNVVIKDKTVSETPTVTHGTDAQNPGKTVVSDLSDRVTNNNTLGEHEAIIDNVNPEPASTTQQVTTGYTPAGAQDLIHNLQSVNEFDHAFTDAQANTDYEKGNLNWREYGNIGVTSTQELIERSRQLALFNIFDIIIADFIKYFCVMIY